jgi:hypothetical protein
MADHLRFGYFFHPSHYRPPLGFAALEVYPARSDPDRFFDTAAALFSVNNGEKTTQVEIAHPFPQSPQRYQVVLGRYHLLAHNGDMVEGVTLGGVLEVETDPNYTRCLLTSPAPIFEIEERGGLVATLEVEIEAELARLRAEWPGSDAAFDCRLASQEPLTLFAASLNMLDDYLHNHPQAMTPDEVLAERTAVHQAIRTLQDAGQWPQPIPTLRELMGWSNLPAASAGSRSAPGPAQPVLPRVKGARPGMTARQGTLDESAGMQASRV